MQATINTLSQLAKDALRSTGSSRIGAVKLPNNGPVFRELLNAGLIGTQGGLTIRGSAVAEKLISAQLDELF